MLADIGVIGLAVMGQNLILNLNDHGYKVLAHNRTEQKITDFLEGSARGTHIRGAITLETLTAGLESPRKILLMVRAGEVVDQYINRLIPLLDEGDIIIDGGNSNYADTSRRVAQLSQHKLHFLGIGVSGGEEGARHGPSIMPGGDQCAWPYLKPILQSIAAKTPEGEACCDWVGSGGAGHFVKMVHNGIEYGDMQLIAEAYHFMQAGLGMSYPEMSACFAEWNNTELDSYLVEITADILAFKDKQGEHLVEHILDAAGQKGTGKWTGINALELGVPLTLITESVFARCLSALQPERVSASEHFKGADAIVLDSAEAKVKCLDDLRQALLASKIISYAQGFMLMREASNENNWDLNYGNVALMWREGCIIRSAFLGNIRDAFAKSPDLLFLGLDDYFKNLLIQCLPAWRRIVSQAMQHGLPMPCMSSALNFLNAYASERLPANLIQAQRDYFGAHTYERLDHARGEFFHTDWAQTGGNVSSSSYEV